MNKTSTSKKKNIPLNETKGLDHFLGLNYPYTVEEYEEDGKRFFSLSIPDLPGCGAIGETIEEALKNLEEAKKAWIEVCLEEGLPIPEPESEKEFSGKFLLRIPPRLHMKLKKLAEKDGMSLNKYISSILKEKLSNHALLGEFEKIFRAYLEEYFNTSFGIIFHEIESLKAENLRLTERLHIIEHRSQIAYGTGVLGSGTWTMNVGTFQETEVDQCTTVVTGTVVPQLLGGPFSKKRDMEAA